jgi:hypothetical protein
MVATAVGGGIQAYGQYQQGQAQARLAQWKGANDVIAAQEALQNAALDVTSGEQRAYTAGAQGRATIGREIVRAGAGNVAVGQGSINQVTDSALSIARNNQDRLRFDAAHAAWGEDIKAASLQSEAGAEVIAAKNAVAAGDIGAAGTVVSTIGQVASKWGQAEQTGVFAPAPTQQQPSSWTWTG